MSFPDPLKPEFMESPTGLPPITQHDRALAAGIHIISIPAPLWGPLIAGFVMRGKSQYAEAHAWKALKEYIVLSACLLAWGLVSFTWSAIRIYQAWQNDWQGFNWWELLGRFALGWVLFFTLAAVTFTLSLIQAWQAWRGNWPKSAVKKAAKTA